MAGSFGPTICPEYICALLALSTLQHPSYSPPKDLECHLCSEGPLGPVLVLEARAPVASVRRLRLRSIPVATLAVYAWNNTQSSRGSCARIPVRSSEYVNPAHIEVT